MKKEIFTLKSQGDLEMKIDGYMSPFLRIDLIVQKKNFVCRTNIYQEMQDSSLMNFQLQK